MHVGVMLRNGVGESRDNDFGVIVTPVHLPILKPAVPHTVGPARISRLQ